MVRSSCHSQKFGQEVWLAQCRLKRSNKLIVKVFQLSGDLVDPVLIIDIEKGKDVTVCGTAFTFATAKMLSSGQFRFSLNGYMFTETASKISFCLVHFVPRRYNIE